MKINGNRLQCEEDRTKNGYFIATRPWKTFLGITDNMGKHQYWY